MPPNDLKTRTKVFGIAIIRLTESLPKTRTADVIAKQLLRCGTSIGANYRAACRARSRADFIAKMGIVEEETDEAMYWLEILAELNLIGEDQTRVLYDEANELLAITVASIKTAKRNRT